MFFDSHAHLNDKKFKNNLHQVIEKAFENNVKYIVVNGYDIESSKKAIEIASEYDNIYATVGIHPLDVDGFDIKDLQVLKDLCSDDNVVAIGEIGLDYYYDKSKMEVQKEVFMAQLQLASELNMPVTIHSRDALNDTYEILKNYNCKGVMHCYSGSVEYAKKFIELGYYISLAGPVTFKNAKVAKEVAKEVTLDKLLIETDAPYLTPHPYRGQLNDPSYVTYVAEEIAGIKGLTVEEVANQTTKNAQQLYRIRGGLNEN